MVPRNEYAKAHELDNDKTQKRLNGVRALVMPDCIQAVCLGFRLSPGRTARIELIRVCSLFRKPGLGHDWFKKYTSDVFPHDFVIMEGRQFPVPNYYDVLYERSNPIEMEKIKETRNVVYYLLV